MSTHRGTTLVWFRDELRTADHPALDAAIRRGAPVVAVYFFDEHSARAPGAAARWWLHHSLHAHRERLAALGIPLVLRRGPASRLLPELVHQTGADAVVWNRRYTPARAVDAALKAQLREAGLDVRTFAGELLAEPGALHSGSGTPYQVFTPFWKRLREHPIRRELPTPPPVSSPAEAPPSDELDEWGLLPRQPDWATGLRRTWTPGEASGEERLTLFAHGGIDDYSDRDLPARDAGSRLSPHLRWGELSTVQLWHRIQATGAPDAEAFLRELGWREFFRHTLFHEPLLAERNLRPAFDAFPWREPEPEELRAWQHGHTGIPLVDAGMRELWNTGTMHNRVRMSAASFLVKHLLVDWRVGERWFWDTLVDADEASNPGNWQWVAGSGQDAAPYFRIFNPERQAERFDPDGSYRRRWVPEIGTPAYPAPIVDLAAGRERALTAFERIRRG